MMRDGLRNVDALPSEAGRPSFGGIRESAIGGFVEDRNVVIEYR
jgi:hypothetical protein